MFTTDVFVPSHANFLIKHWHEYFFLDIDMQDQRAKHVELNVLCPFKYIICSLCSFVNLVSQWIFQYRATIVQLSQKIVFHVTEGFLTNAAMFIVRAINKTPLQYTLVIENIYLKRKIADPCSPMFSCDFRNRPSQIILDHLSTEICPWWINIFLHFLYFVETPSEPTNV